MRDGCKKKNDTNLKKFGSVSGGKTSKPMRRSKTMLEPAFPTKEYLLQTPFWQKKDMDFFLAIFSAV